MNSRSLPDLHSSPPDPVLDPLHLGSPTAGGCATGLLPGRLGPPRDTHLRSLLEKGTRPKSGNPYPYTTGGAWIMSQQEPFVKLLLQIPDIVMKRNRNLKVL